MQGEIEKKWKSLAVYEFDLVYYKMRNDSEIIASAVIIQKIVITITTFILLWFRSYSY